jgi:hypothetical protein
VLDELASSSKRKKPKPRPKRSDKDKAYSLLLRDAYLYYSGQDDIDPELEFDDELAEGEL